MRSIIYLTRLFGALMGGYVNLTDKIIKYEQDDMISEEIIELFQDLMNTGIIYNLQGSYQRVANKLLLAGLIHNTEEK